MRQTFIIVLVLFFGIKNSCIAQQGKTCTVIKYIGISDKPIYPIVFCQPDFDTAFIKSATKLYEKFTPHNLEMLIFDSLSYAYIANKICSSLELSKVNKTRNYTATFSITRYENGKEIQRLYLINSDGRGKNFFNGIKNSMIEMEKDDSYFRYINEIVDRLYW